MKYARYICLLIMLMIGGIVTVLNAQKLHKYTSMVEHFDSDLYLTMYNRVFDEEGILTQKKEYHALTIGFYGIARYHDFLDTRDSTYYYEVLNQYKYFCDSSKVVYIDDFKGMGLPYKFNFHDLKADWYSGMTHGVAISFLLRYYELTGDEQALDKVKQLVYFTLRPEEEGGAIGYTQEGLIFLEEYPNSKSHEQVLNGFVNALVGVKEYLEYFPKDTLARRVHNGAYNTMVETVNMYDTPNWTNYDRKNHRCSNQYMRYELSEFEHLYKIYKDERLIRQMMIWSYFNYGKIDKVLKFYRDPNYQFGVPLQKDNKDGYAIHENMFRYFYYLNVLDSKFLKKKLFSSNGVLTLELNKPSKDIVLNFKENIDNFEFILTYDDDDKVENPHTIVSRINDSVVRIFSDNSFSKFKIKGDKKVLKDQIVDSILTSEHFSKKYPAFSWIKIKDVLFLKKGQKYRLNLDGDYLKDGFVFYRYAFKSSDLQKKSKYNLHQVISLDTKEFVAPESADYEFFISIPTKYGISIKSTSGTFLSPID